jgi:arabinose-5-phosphate isomerase
VLKNLLRKKQQYLNHFFEKLDLVAAEHFLQLLRDCQGLFVFTGVGKSGLVAKKIAVTMTSTGSRALYISPTNALHGDLGILTQQDLFIMVSKSGESEELLNLVPFIRNRGVRLLGIVSNPHSRLAKACDFAITLPLEKELCPFDLAPTTSTAIQMIFGDVLAVALMQHQKFSQDQYALNHPAGSIGKRMLVKVKNLMLTGAHVPVCRPQDKLIDTLVELSNKRCGCVIVVDGAHTLQGIFTDGDLRRALLNRGPSVLELSMEQLMIRSPKCIDPGKLAWEAMQCMEADQKNAVTCLPVISSDNTVVGLIKLHDIIQAGL